MPLLCKKSYIMIKFLKKLSSDSYTDYLHQCFDFFSKNKMSNPTYLYKILIKSILPTKNQHITYSTIIIYNIVNKMCFIKFKNISIFGYIAYLFSFYKCIFCYDLIHKICITYIHFENYLKPSAIFEFKL